MAKTFATFLHSVLLKVGGFTWFYSSSLKKIIKELDFIKCNILNIDLGRE